MVHSKLALEEENIFLYYFFPNIYTYISENYFLKYRMLIVKYIYD